MELIGGSTDLIANAIMLHNVEDLTRVLNEMNAEGKETWKELVTGLSPYIRDQIRRFGRYEVNMDEYPADLGGRYYLVSFKHE